MTTGILDLELRDVDDRVCTLRDLLAPGRLLVVVFLRHFG